MTDLVAVYGTLKRGGSNHDLLLDAEFVGEDFLFEITLYDLGHFPGAKYEESEGVFIEIYRVDQPTLELIDQLEGYQADNLADSYYLRQPITSSYGSVWVYLYNLPLTHEQKITSGNWCAQGQGQGR